MGIEPLELALRSEIGVVVSPEDLDTVPQVVEKLKAKKNEYKARLSNLRQRNIYSIGSSSMIGAKHIIDLANR